MTRIFAVLVAVTCAACASKYEPGMGDDDPGDDVAEVDAAPPADLADAAQVDPPDAAPPQPKPYPPGPYGTKKGDVIANLSWQGFKDTDADSDSDPFNEPAQTITLEDFYAERDEGSKILLITNSAGWCGPCQEEAAELPDLAAQWEPQGVRFMTAMLEDESGSPASTSFAKSWGNTFDLTTPCVADPNTILDPYYVENGIPFNLFIDTETMTIVDKMSGFDTGDAEAIFDAYVH